jgi:hypothetical protein
METKEKDGIDILIEEFQTWCKDNGLPQMSADELLVMENVKKTQEQKQWLLSFIDRWDVAQGILVESI